MDRYARARLELDAQPVELDHLVLEAQQGPRVDLEREMQVDGAVARLFRVEIDLPQLTERVGLDEVALVVDVEPVVDGLTLHIGHETCYVDHCHAFRTLPSLTVIVPNDNDVLELFASICDRTTEVVAGATDWGESGRRPGQYRVDLDVELRETLEMIRRITQAMSDLQSFDCDNIRL